MPSTWPNARSPSRWSVLQAVEARFEAAAEALFPGSSERPAPLRSALSGTDAGNAARCGAVRVTPFEVEHPSGAPLATRCASRSEARCWLHRRHASGSNRSCRPDTAPISTSWSATSSRARPAYHMSWKKIASELDRIGAKRVHAHTYGRRNAGAARRGWRSPRRAGRGRPRSRRMKATARELSRLGREIRACRICRRSSPRPAAPA